MTKRFAVQSDKGPWDRPGWSTASNRRLARTSLAFMVHVSVAAIIIDRCVFLRQIEDPDAADPFPALQPTRAARGPTPVIEARLPMLGHRCAGEFVSWSPGLRSWRAGRSDERWRRRGRRPRRGACELSHSASPGGGSPLNSSTMAWRSACFSRKLSVLRRVRLKKTICFLRSSASIRSPRHGSRAH